MDRELDEEETARGGQQVSQEQPKMPRAQRSRCHRVIESALGSHDGADAA